MKNQHEYICRKEEVEVSTACGHIGHTFVCCRIVGTDRAFNRLSQSGGGEVRDTTTLLGSLVRGTAHIAAALKGGHTASPLNALLSCSAEFVDHRKGISAE